MGKPHFTLARRYTTSLQPSARRGRRPIAPLAEARDLVPALDVASLSDSNVLIRRYGRRNGPPVLALGPPNNRFVAGENGWWRSLALAGGAIDLDRFALLGADLSQARSSRTRSDGEAALLFRTIDTLNLLPLYAVIGCGKSAPLALQFATRIGSMLDRLCIISPPASLIALPALARIKAQTILIASGGPEAALTPLHSAIYSAARVRACHIIRSSFDENAYLYETTQIAPLLHTFLLDETV